MEMNSAALEARIRFLEQMVALAVFVSGHGREVCDKMQPMVDECIAEGIPPEVFRAQDNLRGLLASVKPGPRDAMTPESPA